MTIRHASAEDMEAVAALVRASFDAVVGRYMVYTQQGVGAFLRVFLDHPHLSPDRTFLVADNGDGAVEGFAEFRTSGESSSFLSYLCIATYARGKGLGQALVEAFFEIRPHISEMRLDVFHDNAPALALYQKLGFQSEDVGVWFSKNLPLASNLVPTITDLTTSEACFRAYGFSELTLRHEGRDARLGRIGPCVLRCFSATDFADEYLHAAARAAFPTLTEALYIASGRDVEAQPPSASIVNRSIRLIWTR